MRDSLADAAERPHAPKAARSKHEQIAATRCVQQCLDRLTVVETDPENPPPANGDLIGNTREQLRSRHFRRDRD